MSDEMKQVNADDRLSAVKHRAECLATADGDLERGYAQLSWMLFEVATLQLWRVKYDSFRKYLVDVATFSKKTPGVLHQYFLTVRDLSDTFTADQLATMGISKAIQLRHAKEYAIVLPKTLIDAAMTPSTTVKDLKKLISITLRLPEDDGDWFDLGAEFYVNPEERATIEDAVRVAMLCDPATKKTISISMQRKDVVLKWCMEFLATYGGTEA